MTGTRTATPIVVPPDAANGLSRREPLIAEEVALLDAYRRAANYLSVGQIYLMDNPLLTEPLRPEHIKPRLLGHWGVRQFSFPGGIPSRVAPQVPGSIHEGGELGNSLVRAYGAAFDNPDLLVGAPTGRFAEPRR